MFDNTETKNTTILALDVINYLAKMDIVYIKKEKRNFIKRCMDGD